MNKFFRLLPVIVFSSLALAAPPGACGLGDCRALANESQRLACYDRLAERADAKLIDAPLAAPAPADTPHAAQPLQDGAPSLLGKAWELDPGQRGHILRVRPYQPVYLLPLYHAAQPNQQPSSPAAAHTVSSPLGLGANEAKLQISLKTKIAEDLFGDNGDLWFGYTQTSRWQVYNGGISRPFRETNHEPELMGVWRTDYDFLGWRGRLVNLSLNHQSNGRSLPLSRSWNRIMLSTSLERDNWTLSIRPWWRVPESTDKDDNPDISNYLGRADVQLVRTSGKHQLSALLRHNLRAGDNSRGALQLDYAFPIAGEMRGHVQWFSGYGESLIDYNHRSNYIGVGVSLVEWY